MDRPEFVLRLRAEPRSGDQSDPDGTRRLRAVLKALLRSYGMKCLEVRPATSMRMETTEGKRDA